MKTLELKPGIFWNGVLDPQLRTFDIIMHTEFGTTYNSYIIRGSEKTALVESAKAKFTDSYIASISEITDISKIDYIIVNHTEPDHSGSIERLISLNPNIKIVATATAIGFLKQIVNKSFYSITVKENDTLSLGDKTLRFMVLPNLHWPDTMYSYLEEDGTLFTCDSFGSHYSHEGILRSTVTDEVGYLRATKYYFDNIIGPYKNPYMTAALQRIKDLRIDMICPGHGPVLDSAAGIEQIFKLYREWCEPAPKPQNKQVVIAYVSAYGYTAQLAAQIAQGIGDVSGIDVRAYDMVNTDPAVVSGDITSADGVLFGSPTIVGEALKPIWDLTTSMFSPVHKGKLAAAFGSYGWSGEAVPNLTERLKQLKLRVLDGFRIRFKPSENDLVDAYDFGYNFGCVLLDRENDRKQSGPKKLVKCLICGEIFDSSLKVCPVCGAGPESFIEVSDTVSSFSRDTDQIFTIIGSGAAALNAAKAIRERNKTANIVMISREKVLPYNRPMLTKSMLAGFSPEQLAIEDESWYEENNITLILGKEVVSINAQEKKLTIDDGNILAYDRLIYALGAECFIPPIKNLVNEGKMLEGAVSIRTIDDAVKVKEMLNAGFNGSKGVREAVVIGGGVLGLEAAWELHKSGCHVTVLEALDRLMPRQLDSASSEIIANIALSNQIDVKCGVKITGIKGDGKVAGVECADGTFYPCELLILSCGVRPCVKLASDAGIEIGRAIKIDSHAMTSVPSIYACGDCAEFEGINYALWSQAVEMGKTAGANAAGDNLIYKTVNGALTFAGFDTSLFSCGDLGADPKKQYKTVEFRDDKKNIYEKYYFTNNRICGAIIIGDSSKTATVSEALEKKLPFGEVVKL